MLLQESIQNNNSVRVLCHSVRGQVLCTFPLSFLGNHVSVTLNPYIDPVPVVTQSDQISASEVCYGSPGMYRLKCLDSAV